MAITIADFPSLATRLDSIFNEAAVQKVADMGGLKIFDVTDYPRRTYENMGVHGTAGITGVTPGSDLPTLNNVEGDSLTLTQSYEGGKVAVTKEMRLFDEYEVIDNLAKSITDDAFDKLDQSYADVLLFAASTTYTDVWNRAKTSTGPDGLALASAVHSNNVNATTFSNLIRNSAATTNVALARDAIVTTRSAALRWTDPNGLTRPVKLDTVLVGPANEDLAERLILSSNLPGSQNNDINPLKGRFKIHMWERLDLRSDATNTQAYWYMYDSAKIKNTLRARFGERPTLDAPDEIYANKNWEWSLDFFYAWGFFQPQFLYTSTGAN